MTSKDVGLLLSAVPFYCVVLTHYFAIFINTIVM